MKRFILFSLLLFAMAFSVSATEMRVNRDAVFDDDVGLYVQPYITYCTVEFHNLVACQLATTNAAKDCNQPAAGSYETVKAVETKIRMTLQQFTWFNASKENAYNINHRRHRARTDIYNSNFQFRFTS